MPSGFVFHDKARKEEEYFGMETKATSANRFPFFRFHQAAAAGVGKLE